MNYKLEKLENNMIKLQVSVPAEQFTKGIEKAYRKNVQKFNIPGFRKGKTPKAIIEKMYGEEVFYDDAVNFVIEETYPQAIEENNIEPVDRPNIDVVDLGLGKELIYCATITVKPEAELGEYKGIEVKKIEYPVSDEDVNKAIDSMREKNARIISKEDGIVENDDIAVIDYEGFVDGIAFEGGKGSNHELTIGSGSFIEGFETQLLGKKVNDELDVNVTFPENYSAAQLSNKPAVFKVKINEIKSKELLSIDDEFAKDVSEFENLEDLKTDIRKKQLESNEQKAKKEFEESIIKKVVENGSVDIPKIMVDREIDYMFENMNYRLKYQGITIEQYAQFLNTTVDKMKEDSRDVAYNKVKTELILQKVARVEVIEASEEEIEKQMEKMAKQYNQGVDELKNAIKDNGINMIKDDIISSKTVDFLVQNAVVSA